MLLHLNSVTSEYELYAFELGAKHTGTDRKITQQPYVGKLFKPSNAGVDRENHCLLRFDVQNK